MTAELAYTIAVCTRNRAALLAECLAAALADTASVAGTAGEILVVDNGSTDETRAVVERLSAAEPSATLRYLAEPRLGLARARNRALDEARGAVIAFLDDDAMVHPGWLRSCLDAFATYPIAAAVGGEILPRGAIDFPDWFRPPLTKVYSVMSLSVCSCAPQPFPGEEHPLGASMAFRRTVFECRRFSPRLGRSGNDLISSEETEIFFALRQEGRAILYVPAMRVDHLIDPARLTEDWVIRRYWFDGVSRARLRLGLGVWLKDAALMSAKLVWLPLSRPFVKSSFEDLLWRCRLQKSLGFFSEALRELAFLLLGHRGASGGQDDRVRISGAAPPPAS